MALGRREGERQGDMWIPTGQLTRGPGHPFYGRVNAILRGTR